MPEVINLEHNPEYMRRAINLAVKGMGYVSPNPLVGCVLVKEGRIIGEGYHGEFGGPHAEVMAIRNASEDPADATAFITMEPCSYTGKTPACSKLLIEKGISHVVVGIKDPNPLVNGEGIRQLREAGIQVTTGIFEDEICQMNRGFIKWMITGMPWVIVKLAQSEDGCLSVDECTQTWLTGTESRRYVHELRASVDGILIGRQTALVDDPQLTVRHAEGRNPVRFVADTRRSLPLTLKIFRDQQAETVTLCSNREGEPHRSSFCRYETVAEMNGKLDPVDVLRTIAGSGITTLLIEGGRRLVKSFFDADLVDEFYEFTASGLKLNGKVHNPIRLDDRWELLEKRNLGQDVLRRSVKKAGVCLQES